MPRSGLTTDLVVDAAARIADAEGLENLTLQKVAAQLNVRPSSLFNHVAGLPDLRRKLQLRGVRELAARVGRAAVGRAGDDAVLAAAAAAREYARQHPGLYAASLPSVPSDAPELTGAAEQLVGIFFDLLRQYGFSGDEAVHAVRGLFSIVHGFLMLERAGHFGMPLDVDESFEWFLRRYLAGLKMPEEMSGDERTK